MTCKTYKDEKTGWEVTSCSFKSDEEKKMPKISTEKILKQQEFEVREHMIKEKCIICKKNFKLKEKIILCPIQEPAGDYVINAMAIPLHKKCYFKEK